MKKNITTLVIVLIVLIGAGAGYYFYFREGTSDGNTNRTPLPDPRVITAEIRREYGIPEGIEGEIRYTYNEAGNVASYIEITADTRPADTDRDGLPDDQEEPHGTDVHNPDTDADGWLDGDEVANGSDPTKLDTDGDGLGDLNEFSLYRTDVNKADTDSDGFDDRTEIDTGFDPLGPGKVVTTNPTGTPNSEGDGEVITAEEPSTGDYTITPSQ
ncbi:MAG: LPXTG-domain-containing protein cell wall anchor domain, nonfunctional [Parcubacteria group bacterium GW2011_GWC2_49_9]|nr:MAG: LPXTG-domain-containing protein cell wall anchor domain, nonfunctional [Parcubacteria group bacterium GW2011_GWA2_48_9]KKW14388.1 MAG: LPXTG-domain-containing protein cell wall anchor domain, nonfunctional [Parcubacteria group bacterium GW2011_GWC2_49_9]